MSGVAEHAAAAGAVTCQSRSHHGSRVRTAVSAAAVALAAVFFPPPTVWADDTAAEATWRELKPDLFDDRQIAEDDGVIAIEAPYRAYDAAVVPITVKALRTQGGDDAITAITLVIDENPAPVAAVFRTGPASGDATITTRVRINAYTYVRAVAETKDGSLHMAKAYVKAAGGCSAPALKDQDEALANLGQMKLVQPPAPEDAAVGIARLMIRHPNYSGLQRDPVTQYYIPAHFVREIEVRLDDEAVLAVEAAISMSENPTVEFRYVPPPERTGAVLSVRATDTEGNVFERSWPLAPAADHAANASEPGVVTGSQSAGVTANSDAEIYRP